MARTNIDIDERLIGSVMQRYQLRTKREAVDYALRRLVVPEMGPDEAVAMGGSGWEANLDEIKQAGAPRST